MIDFEYLYKGVCGLANAHRAGTVAELIQTAGVRRQGFGGLWHVINHAAAIVELQRCGFEDVAQQALGAHHQHIRLWRSLPDVKAELGPVIKSEHYPQEAQYWAGCLKRDEARLTHRIKTMYGFSILLTYIEDAEQRQAAHDAFLYLMASMASMISILFSISAHFVTVRLNHV